MVYRWFSLTEISGNELIIDFDWIGVIQITRTENPEEILVTFFRKDNGFTQGVFARSTMETLKAFLTNDPYDY